MFAITVAIIVAIVSAIISARLIVAPRGMSVVLQVSTLVVVTVFLNQVIAYSLQAFMPNVAVGTLVSAMFDLVCLVIRCAFAVVSFLMLKWSDTVLCILSTFAIFLRVIVHSVFRSSFVSIRTSWPFVARAMITLASHTIVSPLPPLIISASKARNDDSCLPALLYSLKLHVACHAAYLLVSVSWVGRAAALVSVLYPGFHAINNVKICVERVIGLYYNIANYKLPLPSHRQATTWLHQVVQRITGTTHRVTIRAINGVSDLFCHVARLRQSTPKPSLSARRSRTSGIETVEVRRLSSPFVEETEDDGMVVHWLKSLFTSSASTAVSVDNTVNNTDLFRDIPTAPVRRINNVFIQDEVTSSNTITALFTAALSNLFQSKHNINQSYDVPSTHFEDDSTREDSGSDSDYCTDTSDNEDVDALVAKIQAISLDSNSPRKLRPTPTYQQSYSYSAQVAQQQRQLELDQRHRDFMYQEQCAYQSVIYRSRLQPVPSRQGVGFTPLRGVPPSSRQHATSFQSGGYGNTIMPTGDSVYQTLTASHTQDLQRLVGSKSAIKGSRARYPLTRHDIARNTKVVFNEHVEVKSVSSWFNKERDYHPPTREVPSLEEYELLNNTVGWLEQEKRAGLF